MQSVLQLPGGQHDTGRHARRGGLKIPSTFTTGEWGISRGDAAENSRLRSVRWSTDDSQHGRRGIPGLTFHSLRLDPDDKWDWTRGFLEEIVRKGGKKSGEFLPWRCIITSEPEPRQDHDWNKGEELGQVR